MVFRQARGEGPYLADLGLEPGWRSGGLATCSVGAAVEDIAFGPLGSLVVADAFTVSRIFRAWRHIVYLDEECLAAEFARAMGDCLTLDNPLVGNEVQEPSQVPAIPSGCQLLVPRMLALPFLRLKSASATSC